MPGNIVSLQRSTDIDNSTKVKLIDPVKKSGVLYRVQFYTSPQQLPLSDSRFKGLENLNPIMSIMVCINIHLGVLMICRLPAITRKK